MEEIVIKIKRYAWLDIVNLILKMYTIFLFFFGLIIQSSETIIQCALMVIVIIIFEFINDGEMILSDKGIKISKFGFVRWRNMDRFDIKSYTIILKVKGERTTKIAISMKEDKKNLANALRFAESELELYSSTNEDN